MKTHRARRLFAPILLAILAFSATLANLTALAQPLQQNSLNSCTHSLILEEFKALALKKSPLVSEIDADYAEQAARAFETETLANPEVSVEQVYTRMKLGGADDSQTNASIALPLRLSNFGSRSRVAALMRRAGDAQKRAKLLELSSRITLQFYSLLALQRAEATISRSESIAARQIKVIHEGVNKGLLSEGDHRLFEGERYRLQAQRSGLLSAIRALQVELSNSSGAVCFLHAKGLPINPALPNRSELMLKARSSDIGEAARAELLVSLSAERDKLAQLDAIPEFAPRIVYQHTNDGGDFLGAGITIPLPLFNRNQGATTRAQAELETARRKLDLLENGALEGRITMLYEALISAIEQSEIYSKRVVPAFREALNSQERLYSQGKGSVIQVWQALRTLNDAEREAIAVWVASETSRIQVSLLVGEEI